MSPEPTPSPATPKPPSRRAGRIALLIVPVIIGAAIGWFAVYGNGPAKPNAAEDAACVGATETARQLAPLFTGEIAALIPAQRPLKIPELTFTGADGQPKTLADWRGRTVLLNLWATWCAPCRKEMPALDALQNQLGGKDFEVVAVNIDTRDADKPRLWLKETGIRDLAYYADPKGQVFQTLKSVGRAHGMPTTILIDSRGCELGTMSGPAEWASPEALKAIRAALPH